MKVNATLPGQYIIWVTSMFASYEDRVVAGMIKKGYIVSAGVDDGQLSNNIPGAAGVVIAFIVACKDPATPLNKVFQDLADVLDEVKVLFYSIIISAVNDCVWVPGNIVLPKSKPSIIKDISNKGNFN
jgi:hypothetical protein